MLGRIDQEIGRAVEEVDKQITGAEGRLAQAEARHDEAMARRERRRRELTQQRALTLQGVDWITDILAQEVVRGMREAASRGFWMTTYAPYGYKRVHVQDGAKKRPKLELNPPADAVVRRVFDMVLQGKSILDVTKTLNAEGIPTTNGKKWLKTTIHTMLSHEAYTGTVVWGANAKDGAPPVRVEDAHPAIVSKRDFQKARRLLGSRAPKKVNPRRASSPYLLSGIAKCETCGKAMTAAEAKSGKYTYYNLPLPAQARQGHLRDPQAQCQEIREDHRR